MVTYPSGHIHWTHIQYILCKLPSNNVQDNVFVYTTMWYIISARIKLVNAPLHFVRAERLGSICTAMKYSKCYQHITCNEGVNGLRSAELIVWKELELSWSLNKNWSFFLPFLQPLENRLVAQLLYWEKSMGVNDRWNHKHVWSWNHALPNIKHRLAIPFYRDWGYDIWHVQTLK